MKKGIEKMEVLSHTIIDPKRAEPYGAWYADIIYQLEFKRINYSIEFVEATLPEFGDYEIIINNNGMECRFVESYKSDLIILRFGNSRGFVNVKLRGKVTIDVMPTGRGMTKRVYIFSNGQEVLNF